MYPKRIVCLTEETTETLYLLGEGDRVVGVSGYTVRPPEARQKPKVSSFLHARYEKIEALNPDLILAFSDLQAEITNDLVKRGYPVFTFNQRSVAEILQMIRVLGGIVGVATGLSAPGFSIAAHHATARQPRLCATRMVGRAERITSMFSRLTQALRLGAFHRPRSARWQSARVASQRVCQWSGPLLLRPGMMRNWV